MTSLRYILALCLFISGLNLPAQSAYDIVQTINSDLEKAEQAFTENRMEESARLAMDCNRIAGNFKLKSEAARSALLLCRIYRDQKNYYDALDFGLRSLELAKELSDEQSMSAHMTLIHLFSEWQAYDQVLKYCKFAASLPLAQNPEIAAILKKEQVKAYQETGQSQKAVWLLEEIIAQSSAKEKQIYLGELMQLQRQRGDQSGALKTGMRLLEVLQSSGSPFEKAACENNLASIYIDLKEYKSAIEHGENALRHFNDNSSSSADILLNLATALFKEKQPSRALSTIETAEAIYARYNQAERYSLSMAMKARILSSIGDLNGALYAANLALNKAQVTDNLILQSEIYALLASISKKTGDELVSEEFLSKANVMKSRADQERSEKAMAQKEKTHSIDNKEKLVLSSIAEAREESLKMLRQVETAREEKKLAQLQFEKEIHEASLRNEQTAREKAQKELELVKAALTAEQQMRTITQLEKDKAARELENKALTFEQAEKEKGLQLLKQENELLESEKKLKIAEMQQELQHKRSRNTVIAFLFIMLALSLAGFFVTRKKNQIIRSTSRQVEEFNKMLKGQNEEIISSIQYARNFQESIIPAEENIQSHLAKSFLIYQPLDIVSGDIPFVVRKENILFVGAIDCIGHGVPAAMLSFMAYYNLSELINDDDDRSCGELLEALHKKLADALRQKHATRGFASGIDIGLCRIDLNNLSLQFAGANLPVLIVSENNTERIKGDLQSVGDVTHGEEVKFLTHTRTLKKSDRIFLLSDGFIHQFGGNDGTKKFSMKRLMDILQELHGSPMQHLRQQLIDTFEGWKGQSVQTDDIVLIGLELNHQTLTPHDR